MPSSWTGDSSWRISDVTFVAKILYKISKGRMVRDKLCRHGGGAFTCLNRGVASFFFHRLKCCDNYF